MKKLVSLICAAAIAVCIFPINARAAEAPELSAKAAILYESTNDVILFESNADERMYPASLTKMMTAVLALEHGNLEDNVTAYQKLLSPLSSSDIYLYPGEQATLRAMLEWLLIPSRNEAANVIAGHIAGSIEEFVGMMNEKAVDLGMIGTHFENPHGLHHDNHYTTARDMLTLAVYAMKNPVFAEIVAMTEVYFTSSKHSTPAHLYTTNHLISRQAQGGYVYEGAIGIKTGYTTPAGNCLAAACEQDGLRYFSIVLGCEKSSEGRTGSFVDTRRLFDFAKDNFSIQPLLKATQPIAELPVTLSDEGTSVVLLPERTISALLPNDFKFEDVALNYEIPESLGAPVEKGQVAGTLKVVYDGKVYGEMSLLCATSLAKSEVKATVNKFQNFISSTLFKVILIAVILLIIVLSVVLVLTMRSKRSRRRRYGRGRYSR